MKKSTSKKKRIRTEESGISVYKAVILLIIGILLAAGITSIVYSSYKILNYREFDIYLEVSGKNNIGLNVDPGVFNFGKIPQGAAAKRNATVSHHYPVDVIVKIDISGNAGDMVSASENYFILPPNITQQIEVIASVPEDRPLGNYSGKLKVYFLRQ